MFQKKEKKKKKDPLIIPVLCTSPRPIAKWSRGPHRKLFAPVLFASWGRFGSILVDPNPTQDRESTPKKKKWKCSVTSNIFSHGLWKNIAAGRMDLQNCTFYPHKTHNFEDPCILIIIIINVAFTSIRSVQNAPGRPPEGPWPRLDGPKRRKEKIENGPTRSQEAGRRENLGFQDGPMGFQQIFFRPQCEKNIGSTVLGKFHHHFC